MTSRIPTNEKDFASYLKRTNDSLTLTVVPTTATSFGWTNLEVHWWSDQFSAFLDPINGLWTKHENPLTKTKSINEQVVNFIKKFHVTANPLLDRAASSPLATTDLAILFNFKIGRKSPTHHTTVIKKILYGFYKTLGGGRVEGKVRTNQETGRFSIDKSEFANGVEVSYALGETAMVNPDDSGTTHKTFTQAIYTIDMGVENKGSAVWITQRLIIFAHPELNGPWAEPQKFYLQ